MLTGKTVPLPRPYRMKVGYDANDQLLQSTLDLYTRGASVFQRLWLTMLAGYTPSDSSLESEQNCLIRWVPLVEPDESLRKHMLNSEDAVRAFNSHWHTSTKSQASESTLLNLINTAKHEDATWVDYRQLHKVSRDPWFSPTVVEHFLDQWIRLQDADTKMVRSMFSLWWQDGNKTDWEGNVKILNAIIGVLQKHSNTCGQAARKILSTLSDKPFPKPLVIHGRRGPKCPLQQFIQSVIGGSKAKTGRPDKVVEGLWSWLAICPNKPLTQELREKMLAKVTAQKDENAEFNINFERNVRGPWCGLLKSRLEKEIGIPYDLDVWSSMCQIALQSMCSWNSNSLRQMRIRQEYYDKLGGLPLSEEVNDIVEKYKHDLEQEFLTGRQIADREEVFDVWEDADDLAEATKNLKTEDQKFDVNLFLLLAQKYQGKEYDRKKLSTELQLCLDRDNLQESLKYLRNPWLRKYSAKCYAFPRFGAKSKSLPLGKIASKNGELSVTMSLYDGKNFVSTEVSVINKRASRELFTGTTSGPCLPRNHLLFRVLHGLSPDPKNESPAAVSINEEEFALQLYKNEKGWYINATAHIHVPKQASGKELESKQGLRVMGVDVGRKEPAYCYVLEKVTAPIGPSYKVGKSVFEYKDMASVKLTEVSHYFDSKNTNSRCVLTCGSQKTNAEDVVVWQKFSGKDCPKNVVSFNLDLAHQLRRYVRNNEAVDDGLVYSTLLHIRGVKLVGDKVKRFRINSGMLSFGRIEALQVALSAIRSLVRKKEDMGEPVPSWLAEQCGFFSQKYNRTRRERVLKTVHAIIAYAIEQKVDMIAAEDLEFMVSEVKTRRSNRGLVQWLPKQITKQLEDQAKLHGIHFKKVNPYHTSWINPATDTLSCRMNRGKLSTLPDKFVSGIRKLLAKKYVEPGSRREVMYNWWANLAKRHKVDLTWSNLVKACGDATMDYPSMYGSLFYNSVHGEYINSDANAACNIALRGVRLLMGLFRKKDKNEGKLIA